MPALLWGWTLDGEAARSSTHLEHYDGINHPIFVLDTRTMHVGQNPPDDVHLLHRRILRQSTVHIHISTLPYCIYKILY